MAAADRAQSLATEVGDSATAGNALLDQSQSLIYLGRYDEAQGRLERALSLARETGQLNHQCVALNRMNILAQRRGDLVAALAHAQAAFEAGRISGNRRQLAGLTGNLGNVRLLFGLYESARSLLETSLAESRAIGDRGSEPYPMCTLASMALDEGRAADALSMAGEAARLSHEVGDRGSESDCVLLTARCHVALGNVREAEGCLDDYEMWEHEAATDPAIDPASLASSVVRVDLARVEGRLDDAASVVERIAAWLESRHDVNAHDLAHVHACQRVLRDIDPARADVWLDMAWRILSQQADRVPPEMRRTYLERIPLNREISEAWALHGHGIEA